MKRPRLDFHGRGLTAAELIAWLQTRPPDSLVMVHSNTKEHRYWLEDHSS